MLKEKRILIVDDDAELGTLLAKAVSDMSDTYQVRIAKDVDEAMVQVRRAQSNSRGFDLVITDIKMSGLTGLELLEALQTIAPETKTIAMTAYNSPDIAQRARQLNVEAYLIKPFVISEFRQIVRDTLNVESVPSEPKRQQQAAAEEELSADQKSAVSQQLASLRMMTGATATLLIHLSGRVISIDTIEPNLRLDQVCTTLEATHRSMSEQMSLAFARDSQVKQSYFGTDTYSVCTYRVNDMYAVAVVFGPAVKEGQVWYYLRETVQTLGTALTGAGAPPKKERRRAHHDVFDMLDRFFPDRAGGGDKKKTEASLTPEMPSPPSLEEQPVAVSPEPDAVPNAGIDINWDVTTDIEWEDIVEETQQGFDGLTLAEAQQQGILTSGWEAEPVAPSEETVDTTLIDDIDWDVPADMDWDTIVEETDKGLEGISFDEAQQRGLVGDITEE